MNPDIERRINETKEPGTLICFIRASTAFKYNDNDPYLESDSGRLKSKSVERGTLALLLYRRPTDSLKHSPVWSLALVNRQLWWVNVTAADVVER